MAKKKIESMDFLKTDFFEIANANNRKKQAVLNAKAKRNRETTKRIAWGLVFLCCILIAGLLDGTVL